jgi:hypothetical protein
MKGLFKTLNPLRGSRHSFNENMPLVPLNNSPDIEARRDQGVSSNFLPIIHIEITEVKLLMICSKN